MAERKVLNKYIPPEFDPAKIPRRRMPKNQQVRVRTMLSMQLRCCTCGNYMNKGTKFNSRKEDVIGETYRGIQIFRFYFKCSKCSAEITLKTDPQNSDYVVESGATRMNFEQWEQDAEEIGDVMKLLESRTLDSKREMDIVSALDELKSMKSRRARVSVDAMFEALQDEKIEEEDEAVIKSIFRGSKQFVNRIDDNEFDDYNVHKKRKVSQDKPTDHESSKRESSGRIVLGSSTIMFSVVKKLNK